MTDANTFYDRGLDTGAAPMMGDDAAFARTVGRRKGLAEATIDEQRARGLGLANDQTDYTNQRGRSLDTGDDTIATRMTNVAPAGTPQPASSQSLGLAPSLPNPGTPQPAMGTGVAPPGATPAPGAAPTAPARMTVGDTYRAQAAQFQRRGNPDQAAKYMGLGLAADIEDVYQQGLSHAAAPGVFEQAAKMVNLADGKITFATDRKSGRTIMSIVQPDGHAEPTVIDERRKAIMLGAQALWDAGYKDAALGKFGQVSADLSAELATRNKTAETVQKANETTQHNAAEEAIGRTNAGAAVTSAGAAVTNANAHMKIADATKDRYNLDRMGHAVQGVDEKTGQLVTKIPVAGHGTGLRFETVPGMEGVKPLPKGGGAGSEMKGFKPGELVSDPHTGEALFRVGPNGEQLPGDPNPLAPTDKGVLAEKAKLSDEGIEQVPYQMPNKKVVWAYTSSKMPGQVFETTAALRAAVGPQRVLGGQTNALGAQGGRGLMVPGRNAPAHLPTREELDVNQQAQDESAYRGF